ncbi:unnamed protein product, partial [Rotaria socialis]
MLGEKIRIIGIYASERDFNVDMNNDTQSSEALLQWTDACSLAPCIPDAATSLASNRTIDYALSNGVPLSIQTYEGGSSSDHKQILSTLSCGRDEQYWQEVWAE